MYLHPLLQVLCHASFGKIPAMLKTVNRNADLTVVGGGLAGSEAAWQAAERGLIVDLYEMRPRKKTGAHTGEGLAELVCSNSLGSNLPDRASGLLKDELRLMGSLLIQIAEQTAVPAGGALAVDREGFAKEVTARLEAHPNIHIIRKEMPRIPAGLTIIASGPLTSSSLSQSIAELSGEQHLYFYDAISPIVRLESINMDVAYRASRYDRGDEVEGDYINCPLNEKEYEKFVNELSSAERIELLEFESELESGVRAGAHEFFEGCLPVEIIAQRGAKSLAFGPMRPVGLDDPRTGRWPHAVVQLRQDNVAGSLYNLVGFQTNLKFPEQRRVLRMIPGLENAKFERYGQMHRNTFIHAPKLLEPTLQFKEREDLFFAGQITGVEGYVGNMATGLLAGLNAARLLEGHVPIRLPATTMLGALCHYITQASEADFQPMKANFGIMPELPSGPRRNRRERARAHTERAHTDLRNHLAESNEMMVLAA
jgi:methylenetetrahydrofolate--tRNA-(uracil-5-)-methyltransferase